MALLDPLSAATGIPESSLRLLCTILAGFPIALLYRVSLDRPLATPTAPALRNTYFALTGLALSYFFNGNDIVHSLVTVLATYLSCALFANARKTAACLVWFINAAYLLGGYYFTATEEYDISWTMSQCVLCLRLMGFAMDYMDGAHLPNPDPSDVSKPVVARDRKSKNPVSFDVDAPLKSLPPIWEFIGYTYFYGSFLIGPQFSFSLYKKFIEYRHLPTGCPEPSGRSRYAVRCLLLGVFYLAVQQVGQMFFETAYLTTPEFAARSLPMKLIIMWFTGKLALNKYLGVWTLNEAPCVLSGITFSGLDENRKGHWDGLCNIDLATFETATTLNHIVASFNMNTNHWLKNYVFKRLRFLNNKHISALVSLFFLAIWHGTHPGYFATFGLEFFDMEAERRLKKLVRPSIDRYLSSLKGIPAVLGQKLLTFSCFILTTSALHYAACQFDALQLPAMIAISNSVYWIGHLALLAIFVAYGIGTAFFPEKRAAKKTEKIVDEIIHEKEL